MPELPEVETVVRELRPWCLGKKIRLQQIFRPSLVKSPLEFFQAFFSAPVEIQKLERLGKWIVFELKPSRLELQASREASEVELGSGTALEDPPRPSFYDGSKDDWKDGSNDPQDPQPASKKALTAQAKPIQKTKPDPATSQSSPTAKTPGPLEPQAETNYFLFIHLRMTGRLILKAPKAKLRDTSQDFFYPLRPSDTPRVSFQLSDGSELLYFDPRALGSLALGTAQQKAELEQSLGIDPLSSTFTVGRLAKLLKNQKSSIKSFLLNPQKIAGIGNIYAAEILFQAKIHPLSSAAKIPEARFKPLHGLIQEVLQQAILNKGTSFKDYLRTDNQKGGFQEHLLVYGKENRPCPLCQRPIVRQKQNQRSSFFCSHCQKLYR